MASRFDISVLEKAQKVPGKPRHKTREVQVGTRTFGGTNPVWVQSMTTTDTFDVEGTIKQIHALEEAGCELVRVTVPKPEDAGALSRIKERIGIPLICDIHFDYKMALAALDHPVDKIRINPGNIGGSGKWCARRRTRASRCASG
jgi:(E)-4-hydroxy-3-methylbut-2-enyl-diphosphate synthase